ncbi:MAG: putative Adenosylhomocysteine nucleosidase [Nitrospira sp.]
MTTIGVFVATRWELAAVRQAFSAREVRVVGGVRCVVARQASVEWWMIPMGVGLERAAATARRVLAAQRLTAIWSTGFACALGPAGIGDVLIGTEATLENSAQAGRPVPCAPAMVEWVKQAVRTQVLPMQSGRFVTVPRVLCLAEEKREIAGRVGGIGLDMESAALGRVALEQGIPFAIVRTVSDLVDESLPLDFNLFLRPSGWAKGVVACVTHPASLVGLNRLRVQSQVAGAQLTALYRSCADRALREGLD